MSHRSRLVNAAAPVGAALLLLAWAAQAQQEPLTAGLATQTEFVETDCLKWVGRPRGVHVDCGYVSVPEDRSKPDGSVIRLAVARLRASVPAPHPDPVIYFAGGPGESPLQRLYWLIDDTRFIWEERDLIVMDLRGTGHSEPSLECPDYHRKKTELLKLDLQPDEALRREVNALLACKRSLTAQGIDVGAYSPHAVAADVADLAAAMGYEAYNLYSTSFGTLLALTVMRDFPEDVRAVVLDGVWPPQVNAAESRHANAAFALQALFRRCEAEPDCAERYPELEQDLWAVVRIHDVSPFTIWEYDWDSWESFEIEVDGHFMLRRVLESLRSTLWIPYLPFLLHQIADGDSDVAHQFANPDPSTKPGPVGNAAGVGLAVVQCRRPLLRQRQDPVAVRCSTPTEPEFRFVAYDAKEFTQDRSKNPYLSYYEMQSVLSRSLEIYQSGHSGHVPNKVTVHKNTEFKEEEILGAIDSFRDSTEVELVQIVRNVHWRAIRFSAQRQPSAHNYPVDRGVYVPIGSNEALLWTQGSVRGVHQQGDMLNVYKEGSLVFPASRRCQTAPGRVATTRHVQMPG